MLLKWYASRLLIRTEPRAYRTRCMPWTVFMRCGSSRPEKVVIGGTLTAVENQLLIRSEPRANGTRFMPWTELMGCGSSRPEKAVVGGDANHVEVALPVGVPANRNFERKRNITSSRQGAVKIWIRFRLLRNNLLKNIYNLPGILQVSNAPVADCYGDTSIFERPCFYLLYPYF